MVFQDLFRAWRGEGLLNQTLDQFTTMVDHTHWMFQQAADSLWKAPDTGDTKKRIRERDIDVNKIERSIRKKIVQHLAIHPGTDVNYCLVLMSVVKDAERLGDYCKNLVEVAEYHPIHPDDNELKGELKKMRDEIEIMFQKVGKTFREQDERLGRELIDKELSLAKEADALIERIFKTEGLTVPQAVCYTLVARYFKRLSAHLGNIATSVVMPIHKLDYYDEDSLPDKR